MKALSPFLAATLLFSPFPSSASPLRDCRDGCDRDFPPGSGRLADGTTLRRLCGDDCRLSWEALVGRRWAVMRYRGGDGAGVLVPDPPGDGPTFVLTPGGRLGFYSGCNTLAAAYGGLKESWGPTWGEGTFEVLPGGMATRRGCPGDLGRQEAALFGFLGAGTVGWVVEGREWPGSYGGTALILVDLETGYETMELLLLGEEDGGDEDGGGSDRATDGCLRSCRRKFSGGGGGGSHASGFPGGGLAACEAECAGEGPAAEPRDGRRDARDGADGADGADRHRKRSAENGAVPPADGGPSGPDKRSMGGEGERSAWEEGRHRKRSGGGPRAAAESMMA